MTTKFTVVDNKIQVSVKANNVVFKISNTGAQGIQGPAGPQGLPGHTLHFGNYISGRYYPMTGSLINYSATTVSLGSNRIDLSPQIFSESITPAEIGAFVTSGIPGSAFKVLIYNSGVDGFPADLVWQSNNIDGSGTNILRSQSTDMPTLQSGVRYWIGLFSATGITVRATATTAAYQIGGFGTVASGTSFGTVIRLTHFPPGFNTPPDPFVFDQSQLKNNIAPPMVIMRK